jgi:hypothetical protein
VTTTIRSSRENKERSGSARTGLKRLAATFTSPKAAIAVIVQTMRTSRTTRMTRTTKSHSLQSSGSFPQHLPTRL